MKKSALKRLLFSPAMPIRCRMTQVMDTHTAPQFASVACPTAEVLVVDDDKHFRGLVRCLLEPNTRVIEAEGASEGLGYLRVHENEIDAVIMDLFFPNDDGIQAIRRLKTFFPATKVIAVSGVDASELYLRISGYLGADAVLPKSHVESLSALLAQVLKR
jgi:CheY-like chemotaxis protein